MSSRTLQVLAYGVALTGTAVASQQSDLTVLTTLSTNTAFVNEQVLLHRQVTANIAAFSITGPASSVIDDADVLQLASQKATTASQQQLSTHWAIFTRAPGTVTIEPHEFQATLPALGGANPVARSKSNPLALKILPAPQSPPGAVWLPAQSLRIEQQWLEPGELLIGEPRAIEVTITVTGQRAAAIPPLKQPTTPGLRWYSSPPKLTDALSELGVTGTRTEYFTIIAQDQNLTELPAFSLAWFNTIERTWHQTQSNTLGIAYKQTVTGQESTVTPSRIGLLLAFLLLVVGWLLFNQQRRPTESLAWRRMNQMMHRGDAKQLRQSVLDWTKLRWPSEKPMGLEQLASKIQEPQQRQAILDLNAAAFSDSHVNREPCVLTLKLALRTLRDHGLSSPADKPSLTTLYPTVSKG